MKILLAVDGSEHSRWAEATLARVAGSGQRVDVVYVTPRVVPGTAGASSVTEALRDNGRRLVRAVARGLPSRFRATGTVLESPDVAGTILAHADKTRTHLIVLGARGLTPLKTFFLGSVSQRVARHAKVAVLVARKRPRKALAVLAGIDGSPEAERALAFLDRLGVPRSARLTLAHVVADPVAFWIPETGFPGGYGNVAAYEESLRALRRRGEALLARVHAVVRRRYAAVRKLLREGHPAGVLLEAARRADLVVLGHRGLSGVDRFLMGSVSHKVSAYAPSSVLIVP